MDCCRPHIFVVVVVVVVVVVMRSAEAGIFFSTCSASLDGLSFVFVVVVVVDRFYIALFSALEQTHCGRV